MKNGGVNKWVKQIENNRRKKKLSSPQTEKNTYRQRGSKIYKTKSSSKTNINVVTGVGKE